MTIDSLINPDDKIFIAGHNGMAGSSILRTLHKNGYHNLLTVNRKDLDLLDINSVNFWFKEYQPSIVIVAAARVGGIEANQKNPVEFLLENMKIQNNLIECAWRNGVKRLLFLGSSCIYPKYASQPIKEESLLTAPLEKTNEWYAIAKISGLKLCQALFQQYGFNAITLMPTNLYGPGDNYNLKNGHVLPALIRRFYEASKRGDNEVICWGSGKPLREFLHVDDLGEACLFALKYWDLSSDNAPCDMDGNLLTYLNVGSGVEISIKHLAESIAKELGFQGDILWDQTKPDGTPRKKLDVTRLTELGWKSKISLDQGLLNTISSFIEEIKLAKVRF